ncbi:OLC1v1035921C1 [Oldenlandia corymbosa var. corymbosa]|uniref:OLC1v1035921C1 n=1 Tax=Oldenlandia corymbosa var. corymbosa TaxID=529605 RepID=A0AAV1CWM3_OLDCO|nr:OLC1v1035921C1 [Oldenlandia corymbosa var. corymbosa]
MGEQVVDLTSGLTVKEKNDTMVDVQDNSNLVSECLVVKPVPKPGNDADIENIHCQSPNKFSALQVIDNDETILLDENDDDVENVFTEGLIELEADLSKKAATDEVQKEDNNSGEQKQLVLFEPVLHEDAIEENASESISKEGDPDECLLISICRGVHAETIRYKKATY